MEIDRQVLRIAEAPLQALVVLADARRILLRRFPYALFYRVLVGDALVLACFHASRDPQSWQQRLEQ